ncbi:MAG: NAD(P)-dependent oxidoreductase [Rhodospirillales bacterium]|nr:NAD(P)-dependent oxidoreductase [Rhodospirillales bacterium]
MTVDPSKGRAVVFGGSGFLGGRVAIHLSKSGREVLSLSSTDIDLAGDNATDLLVDTLRESDDVIFLAALTPDRGNNVEIFWKNLQIAQSFITATARRKPAHVCYISTDGGYPFDDEIVDEKTLTRPTDWYSSAHLARESLFNSAFEDRLCILRPTIIYGPGDPHHSYGPNKFLRDAMTKGVIELNGKGEEKRDHIFVEDAAELICRSCESGYRGLLNLASGQTSTFSGIAEHIESLLSTGKLVRYRPRTRSITHRQYDITKLKNIFPDFQFTGLKNGLSHFFEEEKKTLYG